MKAHGQLRHHFWGSYRCTIAIIFEEDAPIPTVLAMLGDGWEAGTKNPTRAVIGHGDGPWLDSVKAKLEAWGADARAIDSCAKSIDLGEPFHCDVPIPHGALAELAGQARLL